MEPKKTLFRYLHDALVLQITSGKLRYGDRLPAIRTLCDIYKVGIRTVRDVMKALAEEGYVKTVERSHAQVIYRAGEITEDAGYALQAAELLAHRDSIRAMQRTKEFIMPHVYGEASKLCEADVIQACRGDVAGMDTQDTKEKWRRSSVMLQRLVSVYRNALLTELCIDMDLYAQVTVLAGYPNPYDDMSQNAEEGLNAFLNMVAYQDYNGISAVISSMYANSIEPVEQFYEALQADYPQVKPEPASFHWNAEKGRIHTYMEVVRSLIKKIGDGVYADGEYLPTNSQLREQYGISAYTVGKAMDALEDTGLVTKMNQRGGYLITHQGARTKELFINGSTPRADSVTFLSSLHIVALLSKGIALLGCEHLTAEVIERLNKELDDDRNGTMPNGILAALVHAQPYEPLKNIHLQLEKLMLWGYFFSFARQDDEHASTIREKSKIAMKYVMSGNKQAFADMLQNIYYQIFHIMQEALVGFGVADASYLRLP